MSYPCGILRINPSAIIEAVSSAMPSNAMQCDAMRCTMQCDVPCKENVPPG